MLYVEDDAPTRAQLSRFLRRRVGHLVEASNGAEGLARFRAERPALVITDIEMPEVDGLAMAEEIRRLDADIPIVVITAFEEVHYLRRAIEVGVNQYVSKPVDVGKPETALRACARRLRGDALLARERQREVDGLRAHAREALGLLAGGMAHDFNNLLQSVLGNVDLAMFLAGPRTDLVELLAEARTAAVEAGALGRTLNVLSERCFGDLREGHVEPTLTSALAGCGITLHFDLPADLPLVAHDAPLLGRAFAQIAQNAREAMAGEGVLSVTGNVRELAEGEVPPLSAGRYVQLVFRDTGPGIAPDILPRIFDPYFSTKPRGGVRGMGLGLSLCLAILRQHSGLVIASSPPGGGAVFAVLLPAVVSQA